MVLCECTWEYLENTGTIIMILRILAPEIVLAIVGYSKHQKQEGLSEKSERDVETCAEGAIIAVDGVLALMSAPLPKSSTVGGLIRGRRTRNGDSR